MLTKIKQEILYSKEISNLIYSGNVDLVLIGGSRILNLDSPSSDYDITVYINSGASHRQKDWTNITIPSNVKVHYKLINTPLLLNALVSEDIITDAVYYNLLHLSLAALDSSHILYSKKSLHTFLSTLKLHAKPLICLALEKLMLNMRAWLSFSRPFTYYSKSMYHYLAFYYLAKNFTSSNFLGYTDNQKNKLIECKTSKTIPTGFVELFDTTNILNQFTWIYNYPPILKEVQESYGKTNTY